MSQLPGIANIAVGAAKITDYLLNPTHPIGGAKAQFFLAFGFSQSDWIALKKSLLDHPRNNPVATHVSTSQGEKYTVSCSRVTPDGRNPCVVSVWIIEPDSNPRLVTAYPGP